MKKTCRVADRLKFLIGLLRLATYSAAEVSK